jgi:hypothetical protein
MTAESRGARWRRLSPHLERALDLTGEERAGFLEGAALPWGSPVTCNITVAIDPGCGHELDTASVTGDQTDPNPGNETSTVDLFGGGRGPRSRSRPSARPGPRCWRCC